MIYNYKDDIGNNSEEDDYSIEDELPKTWDDLVDPSFKLKGGGIGSGNLHRRGRNYKPVSEATILNQRQQNMPTKKQKTVKPVFRSYRRTIRPTSSTHFSPGTTTNRFTYSNPSNSIEGELSNSCWNARSLTSVPFWEENNRPKDNSLASFRNNGKEEENIIRFQSKNISKETLFAAESSSSFPKQMQHHNTWENQLREESFQPNSPTPTNVLSIINPTRGLINTSIIHKHLSLSNKAQDLQKKSVNNNSFPNQRKTPVSTSLLEKAKPYTDTTLSKNNTNALTDYLGNNYVPKTIHDNASIPFLKINIELAPGLNSLLIVYEDSAPEKLVEEFIQKHRFELSDVARNNITKSIHFLIEKRRIEMSH
ncbi:MAG: hypothetical protein EXX96DRAFT_648169 [Benjaminiella poitrasii]|nr:MAG: hypothetical protein EXX96DRAFT_648169 [Benjaminiella poitrasii]